MQSKAYAKAQGVPATWSQEDHYIARWYTATTVLKLIAKMKLSALPFGKFSLPSLFYWTWLYCIHTTITHGVTWYYRLYEILKERSQQASCIYLVAEITMLIFSSLYFIDTVLMYKDNAILPIHLTKCIVTWEAHFIPSHNSSLYKDELTAFSAKMLPYCYF